MLVRCVVRTSPECLENGTICSFYSPTPVTLAHVERLFPFEGVYHFRVRVNGEAYGMKERSLWLDLTDPHEALHGSSIGGEEAECIEVQAVPLSFPEAYFGEEEGGEDGGEEEDVGSEAVYLEEIGQEMDLHPSNRPLRYPVDKRPSSSSRSGFIGSNSSSSSGGGGRGGGGGWGGGGRHGGTDSSGGSGSGFNKLQQGAGNLFKKIGSAVKKGVAKGKEGAQGITLESVTSGAASLWNKVKTFDLFSAAGGGGGGGSSNALTDTSEENLAELSDLLSSSYSDSNADDVSLLQDLWTMFFPDATFQRQSDKWKEGGWQKSDPILDLKLSGLLAVRAMVHLGLTYPQQTRRMVDENRQNTSTKYPFAVVGINITLLLAELLNLRDQKYLSAQANYWALFEDPAAFFELFSCAFFHLDSIWTERKAVRKDFGKLIGELKILISKTLDRGPKSINEFKMIAIDEGLVVGF